MNIDKTKMKTAYYNRTDKKAMNELVGYFYELANFFVNKAGISNYYKEDYVQFAVARACNKLDLYDPNHINEEGKPSAVFSYFYKLIYMEVRYRMRDTRQKKERRPNTCSYDTISAIIEDEHSSDNVIAYTHEDEERHIIVAGKIFNRAEVIEAVKQARKLLNKAKKNVEFIPDTENEVVLYFYHKLKGQYEDSKLKVEA